MKSADFYLNGAILLIDKPIGVTSFDVVRRIRGIIKKKYQLKGIKVGHAGTLDPLASGLLVICTGKATKNIDALINDSKVYTGQGKLGYTTPSYDRETLEIATNRPLPTDITELQTAASTFEGEILQTPPLYSAIKIDGLRAYELARSGQQKELKARPVQIFKFEISNFSPPFFDFMVHCSKGTYIRSLIHDFGQRLDCGAYLTELRRIQSGEFRIEDSIKLESLEEVL
ncbi:tRNA pseudouridine(55) synthase TruB [Thermaurantimonas aggregans]|uniref:tRNA pseudouridine(55) synthase TruB n=1 Tax=Thermaurantimonas aggregans TaxID=2173829 RepID=UPI0023F21B1D|nr:tRNA pseudouridine(55) synthase TruB [Thermaurantimonas aggregans]MCX8149507.1 tRNA pseudouridine(55) synthase TruB [Thermaurantimonas aggregans]